MKIVHFAVYTTLYPVKNYRMRRSIIVCLTDETGKTGLGEIAPLDGRSVESFDESLQAILDARKKMLSSDLLPIPLPPSVLFGLSSALLDLSTSFNKNSFEICHLAFVGDPIISGIKHIKIKASKSLDDTEIYIRKWIEKGTKVRVDVNAKWDLKSVVNFANRFTRDDIVYLEDPVTLNDIDLFCEQCNIPVAIDAPLRSNPIEVVLRKKISYVILKPSILGGIEPCKEIVEAARDCDVVPVFSSSYETLIGLSHIVRMGMSLDNTMPFGVDTLKLFKKQLTLDEKKFIKGTVKPFNIEGFIGNELLPYS